MYQESITDPNKICGFSPKKNSSSQTLVFHKKFKYPGICNLCFFQNHQTQDCPFAMAFYHATNKDSLPSILENGLNPGSGRLGKGVYVSDDSEMCIKYALKKENNFKNPILLKLKVMISGKIVQIEHQNESKSISLQTIKKHGIQAIKCPYFRLFDHTLYEYLLINPEVIVISSWYSINEHEFINNPFRKYNDIKDQIEKEKYLEKYYRGLQLKFGKKIAKIKTQVIKNRMKNNSHPRYNQTKSSVDPK